MVNRALYGDDRARDRSSLAETASSPGVGMRYHLGAPHSRGSNTPGVLNLMPGTPGNEPFAVITRDYVVDREQHTYTELYACVSNVMNTSTAW